MDNGQFQEWLSGMDRLIAAQWTEMETALSGHPQASASLVALDADIIAEGRHYSRCGTPLTGFHRRKRLPGFGVCPAAGKTVRESAAHCGIVANTAFRRQYRFLAAQNRESSHLRDIAEAAETPFPGVRKPERSLAMVSYRRNR